MISGLLKSVIPFTFLFVFCTILHSQDEDRRIWDSPYGEDRFIIGFNSDYWLGADSIDQRAISLGFDGHIMYDYKLGKSIFSLAWGYGISSHNVHHNGSFRKDTINSEEQLVLRSFPTEYNYRKNKHSSTFIEVPFEIRLRTRGPNKFKLFVGAKAGYLVNYHWKIDDDDGKRKFYDLDGINKIRYGVTGRIGFNMFNISAFYSLTPYLEDGEGEELIPISIGLSIFLL